MKALHLTTHVNIGGITTYISKLVRPLRALGCETYVLSGGGSQTADLKARGATVFELPIRTKSELHPKLFLAIPKIEKIIRENGIDLLHAHTRVTQVVAAIIHKRTGIPVITTCHGYFKNRLGRRLFPAWGNRTIAISSGVADHLIQDFKLNTESISTVNNGVDLNELEQAYSKWSSTEAKAKFGFQPGQPVVGVVARLVADKGHEFLIRALPLLRNDFPDLGVLIVGSGRNLEFLQDLTRQLGVESRVKFTGSIDDVASALAAMDIFTLPATWREGFGLSIVEAMACRKPIIVSNIWSLNSLIENKVTGILIEPKHAQALADSIKFLLTHPDAGKEMAESAYLMTKSQFTIERMAREIYQAYQQAVPVKKA